MEDNVMIGQYIHRDSILHILDPRAKLICIFLFIISCLFLQSFVSYVLAGIFVSVCMYLSKISYSFFIKGLKPIILILSFTFFYHIFMTEGRQLLFAYRFFHIYEEGILKGVMLIVKIIFMVLMTSLLTLTTKPLDLAYGLETLLRPLKKIKFPLEQFSLMLSIALRFIPTILAEAHRIQEAQKARGISFEDQNLIKKLSGYISIIVPLLLTSIQHAENLSLAIEARAYGDGSGRTKYKTLHYTKLDYKTMLLAFCVFASFVVLKYWSDFY